jgi:hypothetical protein
LSRDPSVNAADLAAELGIENPRVRAQLVAFSKGGLLTPAAPMAGKRWYVRNDSPFWATCLTMMRHWAGQYADPEENLELPAKPPRER